MKITINDDFDLLKIADSGQCFRFNACGEGFTVMALDKYLFIKKVGEKEYELSCSEEEYEGFWKEYFDLGLSYSELRGRIDPAEDPYLYAAAEYGKGIRILKQDLWEMLISFIISQRKNIPAIKASIEKLCAKVGRKAGETPEGEILYAFPTAKEIASLSMEDLAACSLGYRDKYVMKAAREVASGYVDLESWKDLDDAGLMERLLELFGVGVKVANCEILFGYHRLDAFPKDVWINRVLDRQYPGGFMFDKYTPYNGIMQQYLFFYSRTTM
ncbi:DNA-3-methyladenine glycosylase family protein [Butyrivibrio sp. MC2021]|uniref:DNA-3-methyladenine glycosylase family protein n=1 Tax=Butyrivibrio sp. MC2021 TaxID=1408306 RepID=UPI0005624969|nr:DNA glycosylase [Butyrivibrio sp. MC2021]